MRNRMWGYEIHLQLQFKEGMLELGELRKSLWASKSLGCNELCNAKWEDHCQTMDDWDDSEKTMRTNQPSFKEG